MWLDLPGLLELASDIALIDLVLTANCTKEGQFCVPYYIKFHL